MASTSLSPNLDLEHALRRAAGGSMSAVIYTLAMYRSRKQVKEELRRQGHKVSEYSARDISVMAEMWAAMHRDELIADAKAMIGKSPELTKMPRTLRALAEHAFGSHALSPF